MSSTFTSPRHLAAARYREYRSHTRTLLEEDLLHVYGRRIDVSAIDDDVLRRAEQDWYPCAGRKVDWDWRNQIMRRHWNQGVRGLDLAFSVKGQLCGLAVARLSPAKEWLSLTYLEGSPTEHPLKGEVLAIAVRGLYVYKGVICHGPTGVRALNPLAGAIAHYESKGYTASPNNKRLQTIVIEPFMRKRNEDATERDTKAEARA